MKEKTKKSHSFLSNTVFIFRLVTKTDKLIVPIWFAVDALTMVTELNVVSFVTALTYCLEHDKGIGAITLVTLIIAGIQIVLRLIDNSFSPILFSREAKSERAFDLLLFEKVMDIDFDILEGPIGREKYQKAQNALSYQGVYQFLSRYGNLVLFVIGIFTYGTITARLNPWLILILTALELLKLVSNVVESRLVNKTRTPLAKTDRRLNYVNKTARDFAIGKDIRIYKLRNYLKQMSEYFLGERKFWTTKQYFYYFCADMIGLFIDVGIEIGIFAYLIYSMLHGNISKTELVLFSCTVTEFTGWISMFSNLVSDIVPMNLQIENLREFLEIENIRENQNGKPLPTETPYTIEFRDVCYRYPGSEKDTLHQINLTIRGGESIALVGVNGAGKTTLVKLLCGLYRPTSGKILLNGVDISELNRDAYYRVISAVFQDLRFLPCTILENVSMCPAEKSDRVRFETAVEAAGLSEKIRSLTEKEDTYLVKSINENAVELSGGEMQRLLLARAVYKDAPILVLDEPTAALDPIAENEIYLRYHDISKNKTSVYISHRLSSTRFCDRIVLLDNNTIAEIGSHAQLMRQKGKYAEMFDIQSKYYREGANGDAEE